MSKISWGVKERKQADVELRLTQAEAVRLSFGCCLIN